MQFYPADWLGDTRSLSLAAKGAWIDILCILHSSTTRGERTLSLIEWSRIMGASLEQSVSVIDELATSGVADVSQNGNAVCNGICNAVCNANVTPDVTLVTLCNRRMKNEAITQAQARAIAREKTRIRVERHRLAKKRNPDSEHRKSNDSEGGCNASNAPVTPYNLETRNYNTINPPLPPTGGERRETTNFPDCLNTPVFQAAWREWLDYRKSQRWKPLKPASITRQLAALSEYGEAGAIDSINQSIRNSWQGLFPIKNKPGSNSRGPSEFGSAF